ncbi:protein adenylyltransferase SelO-1, mitochondrial-like [Centruroides vittatus]|uniref:protein adenylyltransferase SelO-1, mitochondrial-like n=1 Tax=Centruroides vittatus TaxID=120091 RepID=UPI00351049F0
MATLDRLRFDNLAIRELPIDPVEENYVRNVRNACFSRVEPTPVENPVTVAYSIGAFQLLDLPESELRRDDFSQYFSGNKLLKGSEPAAHCYCGHQFGYFSGQLGDGAAMYLGEVINSKGERWEIQLKGAGKTPYSRQADGRKVLRSSIREFLCSEAMHYLGIPTTRAGSCVTSDTKVIRDIFYDGHPVLERCTIVSRIAPTFLRFGSFEIFKTIDEFTGRVGPSVGRTDILVKMLEYTIKTFFPEIHHNFDSPVEKYQAFFKEVVLKTARLVAEWQCVGFCHGVLNTDNMSIIGLTIDYGPYGFLDRFNPDHICNASDDGGRYTFIKQPEICLWNLHKLAEAIQNAVPLADTLPLLELYQPEFEKCYLGKMRKKFGLMKIEKEDKELIDSFHKAMAETGADFTNSFRNLSKVTLPGLPDYEANLSNLKEMLLEQCCSLEELIEMNQSGMDSRQFQMFLLLMQMNPELLEQLGKGPVAIERVMQKMEYAEKLKKLKPEEKVTNDDEIWSGWVEKYNKRLHQEIKDIKDVKELEQLQKERMEIMNSSNPRFILRNYIAENAIRQAKNGDFEEVNRVLKFLENPFSDTAVYETFQHTDCLDKTNDNDYATSSHVEELQKSLDFYDCKPPEWARSLRVT